MCVWIHLSCISHIFVLGDASSRSRLVLRLSVGESREDRYHWPISGLRGRDRPGIWSLGRQRAPADRCRQRDAICGSWAGWTHNFTQLITCLQSGGLGNQCGSMVKIWEGRERKKWRIAFKLTQLHRGGEEVALHVTQLVLYVHEYRIERTLSQCKLWKGLFF